MAQFNSWDAPPERRSLQQWTLGHYLTLCYASCPTTAPAALAIQQLQRATVLEGTADTLLLCHHRALAQTAALLSVQRAEQAQTLVLPPRPHRLPAIYVGWGAGIAADAIADNCTDVEQLHTILHDAAAAGERRLVGSLLCDAGIFEFLVEDVNLTEGVFGMGETAVVRDGTGVWRTPELAYAYYQLLTALQQPAALTPGKWALSSRLMLESMAKEIGLKRCQLPHYYRIGALTTPEEVSTVTTSASSPLSSAKYTALLAGGPADRARELKVKLRQLYDIDVVAHWEWHHHNHFQRPLPQSVNLVLVVHDMLGHADSDRVLSKAKAAQVRAIVIERKMSETRCILETRHGFVPQPGVTPVAAPPKLTLVPPVAPVPSPPPPVTPPPEPVAPEPAVAPATMTFRLGRGHVTVDTEVLELWLVDRTTPGGRTLVEAVYADYCDWCQVNGATALHNTLFAQWLNYKGFARRHTTVKGTPTFFRSLTLTPQTTPASEPAPPPVAVPPVKTPVPPKAPPKQGGPDYEALDLFLLECCRVGEGEIETMRLYSVFSSWCLRHKCRTMSPQAMERHLRQQRVPHAGEQWQLTLLSEVAAPPSPPPAPVVPTPAPAAAAAADLRGKLLAQLTEIQRQLHAAGIAEVVLTPAGLNLKVQ